MKTTVLVLCVLAATAAFGQSVAGGSVLSNQTSVMQVPSHPQHASQKSMFRLQSVMEASAPVYGRGERPLWEFAPVADAKPLGDLARMLRKEHATVKKAEKVWEN